MRTNIVVLILCSVAILHSTEGRTADQIQVEAPVTTKLAGASAPLALPSVLRVVCTKDNTVGTGFFHKSGVVISAEHVVLPCEAKDLLLILPSGEKAAVESAIVDDKRDLAILKPKPALQLPSLPISTAPSLAIGDQVAAWGFPSVPMMMRHRPQ